MSHRPSTDRETVYLIRIDEVLRRLPMSRASFYAGIKAGMYPRPVRIGKRSVAWLEPEINGLIANFRPSSISPR
jgi:prophage regulatory protein